MSNISQLKAVEVLEVMPSAESAPRGASTRRRLSSSPIVVFNNPRSILKLQEIECDYVMKQQQQGKNDVPADEHEEKENHLIPQQDERSPALARKKALAHLRSKIIKLEQKQEKDLRILRDDTNMTINTAEYVEQTKPAQPMRVAVAVSSPVRPLPSQHKAFSDLLEDACATGKAYSKPITHALPQPHYQHEHEHEARSVAQVLTSPVSLTSVHTAHTPPAALPMASKSTPCTSSPSPCPGVPSGASPSVQLSAGARAKLKRLRGAEANRNKVSPSPSPSPSPSLQSSEAILPYPTVFNYFNQERESFLSPPTVITGSPVRRFSPIVPSAAAAADQSAMTRRSQMLDVANMLTSVEALDTAEVPSIRTLAQRLDSKRRNNMGERQD